MTRWDKENPQPIGDCVRAAIYARLSLADDNSTLTERQEKDCRRCPSRHDLDVVEVFVEEGVSGYNDVEGPDFDRAQQRLRRSLDLEGMGTCSRSRCEVLTEFLNVDHRVTVDDRAGIKQFTFEPWPKDCPANSDSRMHPLTAATRPARSASR